MKTDNLEEVLALGSRLLCFTTASCEYQQLYNEGRYSDALAAIDARSREQQDDVYSRIAWIACQLHLENVPITALSSPVEDLMPLLESRPEFYQQCIGLLLVIAIKLIKRDKLRLAVFELERAVEFSRKGVFAADVLMKIQNLLFETISDEVIRAEKRREDKQYIEGLKQSLEKYRCAVPKFGTDGFSSQKVTFGRRRGSFFNSKSLVSNVPNIVSDSAHQPTNDQGKLTDSSGAEVTKARKTSNLVFCIVCIVILAALYWSASGRARISDAELAQRLSLHAVNDDVSMILAPNIVRHQERADEIGSLAALQLKQVKERLGKKLDDVKSQAPNIKADAVEGRLGESSKLSGKAEIIKDIQEDLQKQEGVAADIQRLGFEASHREVGAKLPSLDANAQRGRAVESLDVKSGRIETSDLKISNDGRVFGPPQDATINSKNNETYSRGGYEVKQFQGPALYRIIVKTKVLSAPSAVSYVAAELEPGSKVHVMTQLGPWLELVSVKGKRGYIYAQDAEYQGLVRDKDMVDTLKGLE